MLVPPLFRFLPAAAIVLAAGWLRPAPAQAGVVVLSNRTAAKVDFVVVEPDGQKRRYSMPPSGVAPIPVADRIGVAFYVGTTPRRVTVRANSIYYFLNRNDKLDLVRVTFPSASEREDPPALPVRLDSIGTIPVMLLVDDDEPAVRRLWEKRLRERLAAASAVFEHHCRIRFEVVALGTWVSDDRIFEFEKSLREFELKVTPAPARVAIGFTSQYRMPRRRAHLGGTRGALHSHILIREWAQHVSKAERLEVLIHELGHFLGATHSKESNSVMRSVLGDHRSHARSFRIGFDAPNTLIMNLVCEELRTRGVRNLGQLHPATKTRLRTVYSALSEIMPKDPAAKHYLALLDRPRIVRTRPTPYYPESLVGATQVVIRAITEAARENGAGGTRLSGDRLTEHYVRHAATAAGRLPSEQAAKAFLLGLGIALDSSTILRSHPIVSGLCRRVESNQNRTDRLAVLGSPTMRGRRDLTQHFVVSGALTTLVGPHGAETAGIAKELSDSHGTSGFSFVDLSANLAGVTFATHLRASRIPLAKVAASFAVEDFLPDGSDLEEGISWQDFLKQYDSAHGDRFLREQAEIRKRILALPGYAVQ
jgi:hypothetical protein